MIWTDILYLSKLLGFTVTPKLTSKSSPLARGVVNGLLLAAWLVVKFWKGFGMEGWQKLDVAEFDSTSKSVQSGYKI